MHSVANQQKLSSGSEKPGRTASHGPFEDISLPMLITAAHEPFLSLIESKNPSLIAFCTEIFEAFNADASQNPESDSAIIIVAISRIAAGDPTAKTAMLRHLRKFQQQGCLTAKEVSVFSRQLAPAPDMVPTDHFAGDQSYDVP